MIVDIYNYNYSWNQLTNGEPRWFPRGSVLFVLEQIYAHHDISDRMLQTVILSNLGQKLSQGFAYSFNNIQLNT